MEFETAKLIVEKLRAMKGLEIYQGVAKVSGCIQIVVKAAQLDAAISCSDHCGHHG